MATIHASQPPTYEEVEAQLKKIQAEGFTDEEKKRAEEAMTKKLSEPETKQQIVDEVKALADSAIKIDQAFQRVSVGLGQVDDKKFTSSNGEELPKLRPKWDGFHARYTKILWGSRRTARATEVYLQDFIDVVLPGIQDAANDPNNEKKLQAAKDDLTEFLDRTNPDQEIVDGTDAEGHSQAFTKLSNDINEFKGTFDTFTKTQEIEINAEIKSLQEKITGLNDELQKVDSAISLVGIAIGVTVFSTIVGTAAALSATGPIAPLAVAAVIITGLLATVTELAKLVLYLQEKNEIKEKIAEKKRELTKLQDKLELLKSIQAGLLAQGEDIDDIVNRLDKFAHIWAMIAHDAKGIRQLLHDMTESRTGAILSRRLGLLQQAYVPLKEALFLYAITIDQSGVPKQE